MNIASAKHQIKDAIEAYLQKDDVGMSVLSSVHQRPMFLVGAPGIGKTAIMEQIAGELGIGIVSYSMTHHTRQSALGLPRIEHRCVDGFEFEASEYTMSEIVAAIYDYMQRTDLRQGILFLDEINCVSETLYPSMLQFLQFKTFGKHKVPDGWVVVCAGNPPEYNRSVHEFDIVTLDRLREIDVEPDYASWKEYASMQGLHPAVTTFLETKKDCFYKVESKPGGGKAFVTARGWEDLARVVALYESMGKPVDRDLIVQFLRDDEIADAFSVYYALFQKYRSDYQIDTILAGAADESIKERARQASFDERIALIGLLLDSLSSECSSVLDLEGVVLELRDVLREAKTELLDGSTVDAAVSERVAKIDGALSKKLAAGTASAEYIRRKRLVVAALRDFVGQCKLEKTDEGEEAFRTIEAAYKAEVAKVNPAVACADAKMSCAFDFVDECLGSREMLVFLAELATRRPTTQFVAHYGNERYYAHNSKLQVDSARMGLTERAALLEDLDANIKLEESRTVDMGGAVGISLGGGAGTRSSSQTLSGNVSDADATTGASVVEDGADPVPAVSIQSDAPDGAGSGGGAPSQATLKDYYSGKQFEYGFTSVCKMLLPVERLSGKKVLDICCRRGRGVYKLSSMVGASGSVIGIDWNPAYIAEAQDGIKRACHDSGLKKSNMAFHVAYPEDLIACGIGTATMDAIYVNNVITLCYDQRQAIEEFGRVLHSGGLLIMETIFADRPRNEEIVAKARALGNSVQAARTQEENFAWLEAAGFDTPSIEEDYPVQASQGFEEGSTYEVVKGDEDVRYRAVSLYVYKK